MISQKKYYTYLFMFALLVLVSLQAYYLYNSYKLEEKDLLKEAQEVANLVMKEMDKSDDDNDEELLEYFKTMNHEKYSQANEMNIIRGKMKFQFKKFTPKIDSLLTVFSKEKGFEIALRKEIYSVFDGIHKEELLSNQPLVVYESSKKIKKQNNINLSAWQTNQSTNNTDESLGIHNKDEHIYKVLSRTDFDLLNFRVLILKKIIPLVLVSLLILGLIIFLYWKSIQNLMQQEQKISQLHLTIDSISHELNTPITTMKFALQQVANLETKEMINRQIHRLETTVDSIFAKENSENELLDEKSLRELIKTFKQQNSTINIHETILFEKNNRFSLIDFQQVFQNLTDNSIKYGANELQFDFRFQDQIILKFGDNGIGIPHDETEQIFSKYYRVDREVNHHVNGLGIGLYLVKNIIDKLNGKISVNTKTEQGVEFLIQIPNEN